MEKAMDKGSFRRLVFFKGRISSCHDTDGQQDFTVVQKVWIKLFGGSGSWHKPKTPLPVLAYRRKRRIRILAIFEPWGCPPLAFRG